jgi:pimeloyl-ACP methyl ester carboxylesterase
MGRPLFEESAAIAVESAWELLSRFTGRLLVVAGERDTVIPPGVIRKICGSARNAAERRLFVAPGASHTIITDLRAHAPDQLDRVLGLMTGMLTADGAAGCATGVDGSAEETSGA